jgi:hypothetical protein
MTDGDVIQQYLRPDVQLKFTFACKSLELFWLRWG